MILFSLLARMAGKRQTLTSPPSEPMGILTLFDRASENIRYVGEGRCRNRRSHEVDQRDPGQLMFFESEVGSVIATVSCETPDIYYLEIHPKQYRWFIKLYYSEWGIVGFTKVDGKWEYTCEHTQCVELLTPEDKELWLRDYTEYEEILKATYVLRSRVPVRYHR